MKNAILTAIVCAGLMFLLTFEVLWDFFTDSRRMLNELNEHHD